MQMVLFYAHLIKHKSVKNTVCDLLYDEIQKEMRGVLTGIWVSKQTKEIMNMDNQNGIW